MVVIRPVAADDLDSLFELAHETTFGLTTLPRDRKLLGDRIDESRQGFAKIDQRPRGESYLFVLEDLETHTVVGTCGIVSKVGGFEPFYAYRVETAIHESKTLGIRKEITTLHLVAEHNGPCEIGSLFLKPAYRKGGVGRLLSLSRFLFMADHPHHFDPQVIAELRGVISDRGQSPFWDAVGKHFFEIDFPKADYLSIVNKRFIAELMPKFPLYVLLLPPEAQRVIGEVHEHTAPARKMLESEGFQYMGMVDIFEAGPVLGCERDRVRAVRESVYAIVAAVVDGEIDGEPHVIGNARRDYRACIGAVRRREDGSVELTRACAEALRIGVGDAARFVAMRPQSAES
jgi:arginine N-succinyltransferase